MIDINDNVFVIVLKSFNVFILEDILIESVVVVVFVEDLDIGLGGEFEFFFVGSFKKFKIDFVSGVIRLRRRVDYEFEDLYNLIVMVSDKGILVLILYVNVIVNIFDVNENNIVFVFSGGDFLEVIVYEN